MKKYFIAAATATFTIILNTSPIYAAYVNTNAYIRDYNFNIIDLAEEGDYIEAYDIDPEYPDRTIIYYNGNMGTILTECLSDEYNQEVKQENDESSNYSIDIDIENQYIYLFNNSSLVDSSPCVTGNYGTKDTPKGTYYIFDKAQDIYLIGEDYNCHVNYWLAFNGGIGIHDASWRDDFGGDIYKGSGSHGCINVPYNIAETIYSLCDINTPINIY